VGRRSVDQRHPQDSRLITFLASLGGGRTGDIRSTYRPLHKFSADQTIREMWFGQIHLDSDDKISLGESREVLVQFNSEPVANVVPQHAVR
jgi:hypothetical protein